MSSADCTLYISSCDDYSDLWHGFFYFLEKRWPERSLPIVLASESKTFSADGLDIACPRFYKAGQNVPWGALNLRTLATIDTPYILFMLEDFYLTRHVDHDMIMQCLKWMDEDKDIANFILRPNTAEEGIPSKYHPFRESQKLKWCINAQACIWRKDPNGIPAYLQK